MALASGTQVRGTLTTQDDVFLDSGPNFYFGGHVYNNPDSDNFYWGLSGSATSPIYEIGCYTDFSFKDNVTVNEIVCDKTGQQGTIQKRNYLEVSFTVQTLLPLSVLTKLLRTGAVTRNTTEHAEKMAVGDITGKQTYFPCLWQKVYDDETGDYLLFHGHRCQFIDAWEMGMPYAERWNVKVTMRIFADRTKPAGQWFGTFVRYDDSIV